VWELKGSGCREKKTDRQRHKRDDGTNDADKKRALATTAARR
jgi:hypothetical protein